VTIRLLSYNIRHGGAGREPRLSEVIASCAPDIVVFQEATRPAVIETLAERTGMPHCGAMPRLSLGFMSRVPIARHEWHRPRVSRHAFLELELTHNRFRVFGVHLSAVHAAWTERRRTFELRALLANIAADVERRDGLHALVGDFNTLAPGDVFDPRKLPGRLRALVWLSGGRIRWRTIQIVLDAGYTDAFRALHPADAGWTFPTWHPHVRLDYLFVPSPHLGRVQSCDVVATDAAREASDHFPLLSVIDVPS
jgi:endonuclease/exonuclease/phosphatase family metal-dependent hydrolase